MTTKPIRNFFIASSFIYQDEFFFGEIDRNDVTPHGTDTAVWSKRDAWSHTGVILVETFKRRNELFATQISSRTLQRLSEDLRGGESVQLRRCVPGRQLVLLFQRAQFRETGGRYVTRHGWKREKHAILEVLRNSLDQTFRRQRAEKKNVRRPVRCGGGVDELSLAAWSD